LPATKSASAGAAINNDGIKKTTLKRQRTRMRTKDPPRIGRDIRWKITPKTARNSERKEVGGPRPLAGTPTLSARDRMAVNAIWLKIAKIIDSIFREAT
jgi:hypothetical protein